MKSMISVCVCTYKRPAGLLQLLDALRSQTELDYSFEIIIVDNDSRGSAREIVDRFRSNEAKFTIRYYIEPEQNIALARNRSVTEARGQWLAFIDDDEIPESNWLSRLLATLLHYKSDGIFAPVIPILPENSPPWVTRGRFFERARHSTGENVPAGETRTSNAMLTASKLKQRTQLFDPRYGLTGGSDNHLFSTMLADGARFVWCDEAVVYETIPPSRANLRWLLMRKLRGGQVYADRKIAMKGKRTCAYLLLRGLTVLGASILIAPLLLPFGFHRTVWWLQKGSSALGKLLAFTPYRYEEYRA